MKVNTIGYNWIIVYESGGKVDESECHWKKVDKNE